MKKTDQSTSSNRLILDDSLRECIEANLSAFERRPNADGRLRQAAVALTLVEGIQDDSAHFVLTRRPKHLNQHGGQYALPGGKMDPNESAIETSLRELHEEIGLDIKESEVLGLLDDYQTRSGFNITPVVIWAGINAELKPNPNEVARLFRIPLDDLRAPDLPVLEYIPESQFPVLSTPLATLGHRVFAPTAAFLFQFREVGLFGRHTRVAHLDQPKFAWK